MTKERALQLRRIIEIASALLADSDALEAVELFAAWDASATYKRDDRVRYEGTLYRCLQDHSAQATWTPAAAPSLWARVLIEDPNVISEWAQPDSTNPYMKGNKVSHNGTNWECSIDNNVWEPGVYGWTQL